MHIDSYRFGEIIIQGKKYTSDVIIFPSRVHSQWWRKEGHELQPEDLKMVVAERPEAVVIGTGSHGAMQISPETRRYLEKQGIELIAQVTAQACRTYNQLRESRKVVAALHLTC
jgi:hypothetical protein